MKKLFFFLLSISMILITSCVSEDGLNDFATIGGRIYDPYLQKPIEGVRVHSIPEKFEAITDAEGYYCFDNIAPGKYTIMAEKKSTESIDTQTRSLIVVDKRISGVDFSAGQHYIYVEAKPELDHDFYISVYELTNGQAKDELPLVYDYINSSFGLLPYIIKLGTNNVRSSNAFLSAIFNYCNKRSVAEGLIPCYSGGVCDINADGYRLPTVDEWKYAAKGGKKSKGFLYCGSSDPDETAWFQANSNGNIHNVCNKMPNELGLYDLNGNAEELCYVDGTNVFDLFRIRYMGGNYLSSKDELPYTKSKIEKNKEITEPGLGIRLVRTIK